MEIYIFLIAYIALCGLIIKQEKMYMYVTFCPLILIAGLRAATVGTDTANYISIFHSFSNMSWEALGSSSIEPGYKVWNKLLSYIAGDEQIVVFANSVVICVLIGVFIWNNSTDVKMSTYLFVGLYYYLTAYNAARQYLAIAVTVNSYYFIKKKENTKALFIIGVACLFHYSAAVFLVFWIISLFKQKRFTLLSVVMLLGGVILILKPCVIWLINMLNRFTYYLYDSYFLEGKGWDINILIYLFQLFLICVEIYSLYRKRWGNECQGTSADRLCERDVYLQTMLIILALAFNLMTVEMRLMARVSYGFNLFMIVYIPLVFRRFEQSSRRMLKLAIYGLTGVYYVLMLSHNNHYVVPYEFFWNM